MGLLDSVARYLQPAVSVGTGLLAEPVAGWAGLLSGDATNVQAVRNALTYQPKADSGIQGMNDFQQFMKNVKTTMVDNNPPIQIPVDAYNRAADYWGERSPLAGAAMKTLPAVAATFLAPGSAPIRRAFGSVTGDISPIAGQILDRTFIPSQSTPKPILNQRGYIDISDSQGNLLGKAPENRREVMTMANRLDKLLSDADVPYQREKSGVGGNGSQYFKIEKPQGFSGGDYDTFNMRISDHPEVYGGNDIYVDPKNMSFEQALKAAQEMYPSIQNKSNAAKLPPQLKYLESQPDRLAVYRQAVEKAKQMGYKPSMGDDYYRAIGDQTYSIVNGYK